MLCYYRWKCVWCYRFVWVDLKDVYVIICSFIGLMVFDNNNLMVNNYYVNISYENLFIDINLMIIFIKEGVCFEVKSVIKF